MTVKGLCVQVCRHMPTFTTCDTVRSIDDLVPLHVTLTRHLYAMIALDTFSPDKRCVWPKLSQQQMNSGDEALKRQYADGFKLVS